GFPKARFHVDFGALCVATEYIGPPPTKAEPRVAARASQETLGALASSMQPGTWAELLADDIDAVIGAGRAGGAENAIPYAKSVPWCPIRKRIVIVGGDQGDAPP